MAESLIVFLGPSLDPGLARKIVPADFRGPIRRGDLDRIQPPAKVLIVDGVLDEELELPLAEARRALARGLTLHGGVSTGALLALELADAGMAGHGRVFDFLRGFDGDRRDLVALLYAENNNFALTVPLIHVVLACREHGIGPERLDDLTRRLTAIPLYERSWDRIDAVCGAAGFRLPDGVREGNAKAQDARTLLARFAGDASRSGCAVERGEC